MIHEALPATTKNTTCVVDAVAAALAAAPTGPANRSPGRRAMREKLGARATLVTAPTPWPRAPEVVNNVVTRPAEPPTPAKKSTPGAFGRNPGVQRPAVLARQSVRVRAARHQLGA